MLSQKTQDAIAKAAEVYVQATAAKRPQPIYSQEAALKAVTDILKEDDTPFSEERAAAFNLYANTPHPARALLVLRFMAEQWLALSTTARVN
jgi:hypothetical protein